MILSTYGRTPFPLQSYVVDDFGTLLKLYDDFLARMYMPELALGAVEIVVPDDVYAHAMRDLSEE